jgi:hypothetical protein
VLTIIMEGRKLWHCAALAREMLPRRGKWYSSHRQLKWDDGSSLILSCQKDVESGTGKPKNVT